MHEEAYVYLILILIFVSFFRFLYIKHSDPEIDGELKKIDLEDLKEVGNWDITGKTKIWTPVFDRSPHFRNRIKWKHILYGRQAIDLSFNFPQPYDEWFLYLCSSDLTVIKEYHNVPCITFSPHKRGNFEIVDEGEEFILLLKSDSTEFSYSAVKFQHGDTVLAHKYQERRVLYIDEAGAEEELKNVTQTIIDEMSRAGYDFVSVKDAEKKKKFPSKDIIYETTNAALKGDILFLISTNKEKYGLENHKIEINNELKDIIWDPETDDMVSTVRLDNPDVNTNFKFYERLKVSEESNILPFRVLTFARRYKYIDENDNEIEDYEAEVKKDTEMLEIENENPFAYDKPPTEEKIVESESEYEGETEYEGESEWETEGGEYETEPE